MASRPVQDIYAETLAVFDPDAGPYEPLTTPEVAAATDAKRRTVYKRLKKLVERGELETKEVGSRARVWWRPPPDDGRGAKRRHDVRGDALQQELDEIYDRIDDAVYVLDDEWRFVRTNERAERLLESTEAELRGEIVWEVFPEAAELAFYENYHEAMETQEPVKFEEYFPPHDRWYEVRAYPSEIGLMAYFLDVTDRKARERELEQYEAVIETVTDGVYVVDDQYRFRLVNEAYVEITGYDRETLLGSHISTVVDDVVDLAEQRRQILREGEDDTGVVEVDIEMAAGDQLTAETRYAPLPSDDVFRGTVGAVRDVTERKVREQELVRYEAIIEAVGDPVYALDTQGRFAFVNQALAERSGYDESELLGEHVSIGMDQETIARIESILPDLLARDRRESTTVEYEVITKDGERIPTENHVSLLTDEDGQVSGSAGVLRDITERKTRERELERYETIVETVTDGIIVVDADARIRAVNDAIVEMTGYPRERLVNAPASLVRPDDLDEVMNEVQASLEAGADTEVVETTIQPATAEPFPSVTHFARITLDDGTAGRLGVIRDVSDQVERERELEQSEQRYRTLVDNFPNGAVTLVDDELRYVTVGGTPIKEVGVTADELEGSSLPDILPPAIVEMIVPRYAAALDGEPSTFEEAFGDRHYQFTVLPVRDESGAVFAALGMSQDVTERKRYERELEQRIHQQEIITALGLQALGNRDLDALLATAANLVADTLGNDYCKVLDLDADAGELLLRQGVGWKDGIVGSATVSAVDDDSQAAYTIASRHPVKVENLETESRFTGPDLLREHDVRSGISTIIGPYDDPWGVLGTHDTAHKEFSDHDVNFVQAVANILATAINRHHDEQELATQREHLAVLDNLNSVVREIIDAAIEQSTREEIERVVCEQLAASDSYLFAWIAEIDPKTAEITTRTEAGMGDFRERIGRSTDPREAPDHRSVGETFRSGDMQVSRDVSEDPAFEHWGHGAETYEVRSFASIPIAHEGTLYGVIGIYSERPDAFAEEERAVIGQLGEVVGHAIAATEQKRALMSDEIVEITLRTQNFFEAPDVPDSVDGTVTIDRTVPISGDTFLMYGSATGSGMETVRALVDAESVPDWESVNVLRTDDETARFEVRLIEPPVVSAVAAHGGYIHEATIEDGDFTIVIHLAATTDVSRVIDTISEGYPATEMVTRNQKTRSDRSLQRIRQELSDRLTDRQQAALEAAYHAGFFNWPRDRSGEKIAHSLGIGSSTFHQHLRKAEKQLLNVVLAEV